MTETTRAILLVEDNPGDALLLKEALYDYNSTPPIELTHVSRLNDAIERVQNTSFEAVLLDLSLPDAHGVETVVRMQEGAARLPIVVMTGLDDDSTAVEAVRAGAQDYLVKGQIDGRLLVRALSYAIERKRLEETTHRHLERISGLKDLTLALTASLNLPSVLQVLVEKVERLLPDFAMAVRLWDKERQVLVPVASHDYDNQRWNARLTQGSPHGTLTDQVFSAKTPLLVLDVESDPRVHSPAFWHERGYKAYFGMPLMAGEKTLGVMAFYATKAHQMGAQEIEFLCALASQAAVAIHNSQIHGSITQLAIDLERSNNVKEEFLGVISHELRTPLNVVKGYVEMLQTGFFGEVNQEQADAIEKIANQTRIQLAMINSILSATTMESEVATVQLEEIQLVDFLDDFRVAFPDRADGSLKFNWLYALESINIRSDRIKLQYILQNLINNAAKFTPQGTITVSAELVQSAVAADSKRASLRLRVADTGIGIAEEFLPIIFEKFSQVDSSTTRSHEGIGLGLHIVKRCTELLNGSIKVESELDKGTTFTVTLPCELDDPASVHSWSRISNAPPLGSNREL